ncbi:hypothetical protein TrVGV298_001142 [Trichoderma virens]|nr:hypothetical protein TrVGV298_001142 [Trichoderma virens]
MARTLPDAAEVPILPALPPAAPSFAERLNTKVSLPNAWPVTASMHISQLEEYEETLNSTQFSQPMREEQPPPVASTAAPPKAPTTNNTTATTEEEVIFAILYFAGSGAAAGQKSEPRLYYECPASSQRK